MGAGPGRRACRPRACTSLPRAAPEQPAEPPAAGAHARAPSPRRLRRSNADAFVGFHGADAKPGEPEQAAPVRVTWIPAGVTSAPAGNKPGAAAAPAAAPAQAAPVPAADGRAREGGEAPRRRSRSRSRERDRRSSRSRDRRRSRSRDRRRSRSRDRRRSRSRDRRRSRSRDRRRSRSRGRGDDRGRGAPAAAAPPAAQQQAAAPAVEMVDLESTPGVVLEVAREGTALGEPLVWLQGAERAVAGGAVQQRSAVLARARPCCPPGQPNANADLTLACAVPHCFVPPHRRVRAGDAAGQPRRAGWPPALVRRAAGAPQRLARARAADDRRARQPLPHGPGVGCGAALLRACRVEGRRGVQGGEACRAVPAEAVPRAGAGGCLPSGRPGLRPAHPLLVQPTAPTWTAPGSSEAPAAAGAPAAPHDAGLFACTLACCLPPRPPPLPAPIATALHYNRPKVPKQLRAGSVLKFGASSREYRVARLPPPAARRP